MLQARREYNYYILYIYFINFSMDPMLGCQTGTMALKIASMNIFEC